MGGPVGIARGLCASAVGVDSMQMMDVRYCQTSGGGGGFTG
jgi:hypothetical protein